MTDWSALYLSTVKLSSAAGAAIGFAAFSVAMAVFRLVGDSVVARLGEKRTVVGGGATIAAGMRSLSPRPGRPSRRPASHSSASAPPTSSRWFSARRRRVAGMPASLGVSAVATMGYAGFLIMPPILGFVGRTFGLSASLTIVALMGAAIAGVAALRR